MSSRLLLTVRTAAHLRPVQIVGRLQRAVRALVGGPAVRSPDRTTRLHPRLGELGSAIRARADRPEHEASRRLAADLRDGTFHAVGESVPVEQIEWNAQVRSPLFTYHLHYFDDAPFLAALAAAGDHEAAVRLVGLQSDWCQTARPDTSAGWAPYPTSARIPRWIQALGVLDHLAEPMAGWGEQERQALATSLWSQAHLLTRTLEVDLQGNHLLRNRVALVWAAAALEPAPIPLDTAVQDLASELDRQILPDGMHEERTPAYHALALYDLLELLELFEALGLACPPAWRRHALLMNRALEPFIRRDGSLHPLGDTTPDGRPTPAMIRGLAGGLGGLANPPAEVPSSIPDRTPDEGPWPLPEAGFMGVRTPELDLVLDCGPFGAEHQPGHGHCDGLSFVLSVRGQPVVVDPGIAGYEGDPHRHWARSTAAHNTVQIDGREQTEIWSVFRAARRARPGPASISERDGTFTLTGAVSLWHSRALTHERTLTMDPAAGALEVRDTVSGARGRPIDTRLHLSPHASLADVSDEGSPAPGTGAHGAGWIVTLDSIRLRVEAFGMDGAEVEEGFVFPGWGRTESAPVLHGWMHACPSATASFGWRIRVEALPSDSNSERLSRSSQRE